MRANIVQTANNGVSKLLRRGGRFELQNIIPINSVATEADIVGFEPRVNDGDVEVSRKRIRYSRENIASALPTIMIPQLSNSATTYPPTGSSYTTDQTTGKVTAAGVLAHLTAHYPDIFPDVISDLIVEGQPTFGDVFLGKAELPVNADNFRWAGAVKVFVTPIATEYVISSSGGVSAQIDVANNGAVTTVRMNNAMATEGSTFGVLNSAIGFWRYERMPYLFSDQSSNVGNEVTQAMAISAVDVTLHLIKSNLAGFEAAVYITKGMAANTQNQFNVNLPSSGYAFGENGNVFWRETEFDVNLDTGIPVDSIAIVRIYNTFGNTFLDLVDNLGNTVYLTKIPLGTETNIYYHVLRGSDGGELPNEVYRRYTISYHTFYFVDGDAALAVDTAELIRPASE